MSNPQKVSAGIFAALAIMALLWVPYRMPDSDRKVFGWLWQPVQYTTKADREMAERLHLPTTVRGVPVNVASYPVPPSFYLTDFNLAMVLLAGAASHLLLGRSSRKSSRMVEAPAQALSWNDLWRISLIAIILGALSMGWYERYYLNFERTSWGLPLPWLFYPDEDSRGLPWAKIKTGFRVDLLRLELSLISILLAAFLILHAGRWLLARTGKMPAGWMAPVILAAVPSGILGGLAPTDPEWIGASLGLFGLPFIILVFTWRGRSARVVFAAAAASAIFLWWAAHLADHFRWPHMVRDARDALIIPVLFGICSIPAGAALGIRKLIAWVQIRRKQSGLNVRSAG